MNHKEVVMIFQSPVPFNLLHVFHVMKEAELSFYDIVSDLLTTSLKDRLAYQSLLKDLEEMVEESIIEHCFPSVLGGIEFMAEYTHKELQGTVGLSFIHQLQSVHITDCSTVVVTFFSTGDDALAKIIHPRPRKSGSYLPE